MEWNKRTGEDDLDGGAEDCKDQSLVDDHSDSACERLPKEVEGLGQVDEGDDVQDVPIGSVSVPLKER